MEEHQDFGGVLIAARQPGLHDLGGRRGLVLDDHVPQVRRHLRILSGECADGVALDQRQVGKTIADRTTQ
ncbi:hypothetical protein WSS_A01540 [Rhodococcus opacus M213]|uniref:Uncharacterized protein n=1 Tax=Rhodococcus opacus M213 TaxID=1129896 RepID=K8XSJ5_RHOOP|nr:hypothetical protein [Rhodococcus opacus]EKT84653.1 hypothetical protein WSS_A01540 [Rhodococcus opacus M213]